MSKKVERAEKQEMPAVLPATISEREFVIKLDVHCAEGADKPRSIAIITIGQISEKNGFVSIAQCNAKAVNSKDDSIVHYEGKCPAPRRKGKALIEVRFGNDAYLVRSVVVE